MRQCVVFFIWICKNSSFLKLFCLRDFVVLFLHVIVIFSILSLKHFVALVSILSARVLSHFSFYFFILFLSILNDVLLLCLLS